MNDQQPASDDGLSLATLRRQYEDYVWTKKDEIDEQRQARHYYHGKQWTAKEIAELNKRKQPVLTYNRFARKVDGVVGLLERLRQDPKAYPRTPQHSEGADLATATLRYALDSQDWESIGPESVRPAATEGLSGVALSLVGVEEGDPEIELEEVDNDTFFYDPRSFRMDFSDARYMGLAKWMDIDSVKDMFPDQGEQIDALASTGFSAGSNNEANRDRSVKWTNTAAKHLFVVEHWYKRGNEWLWCFYSGDVKLAEGKSPYIDEKGRTFCRFLMFSAAVDHDGDRYGFFRNLKSPQDEVNHRRSKALHNTLGRRIIAPKGAFEDVEKARAESVRPDGVVEYQLTGNEAPKFDDARSDAEIRAQLEFLAEAKDEIENFGPNPALLGQGVDNQSGRAIALMQQAGIAELGPFIVAHRGWKLRVYRALWNTIQRYWTAERWIRVTDDEGLAQFIQVNGLGLDPQTGQPALVNALGQLDVDIILDEGPDTINMQQDALEGLRMVPAIAEQMPEVVLDLLPVQESVKKRIRERIEAMQQPDPMAQQAQQVALAAEAAKIEETQTKARKNQTSAMRDEAEAFATMVETMTPEPARVPA